MIMVFILLGLVAIIISPVNATEIFNMPSGEIDYRAVPSGSNLTENTTGSGEENIPTANATLFCCPVVEPPR